MKKREYNYSLIALLAAIILVWSVSCTRDLDELELATYPFTPEVFIDGFSGGLNYAAFGGSKVTAFDVDTDVRYSGSASMKIEIPDAGDPAGAYAGGVYHTTVARDLSSYDALTFWAKASKAASVDLVGFGNDLGVSKYLASLKGMRVNSNWQKYIIPIPDPSKLTEERGMFYYSEGPEDGSGYTLWIDELKFEKLGTLAHKKPLILNGLDVTESAINGLNLKLSDLSMSVNMPTGIDQTVYLAPAWFNFASSDANVAQVDESGTVKVLSAGSTIITATSGGTDATGSLTVKSSGDFVHAPDPAVAQEDVISIFSNAYTNVPVDFYNGYWQPYQTTQSADFKVGDDDVLFYTNFNFVGIQFTSPTIDATAMTHLHMDIYIPNEVAPADKMSVKLVDMGPDGALNGTDPTLIYEIAGPLASQSWISVDIALSGLSSRSKLAQIIFERVGTSLSGFYLDNVYLYDNVGGTGIQPTEAAPTPPARDAADVISIYGDEYDNLEGTDYPDWGQATVVSDVSISGNNTLKFAGLNYQGIQLAASQNVSGMEYLHLDFWTANSTGLSIFVISPGPVEKAYALTVPTTGWTSVDIPLTQFSPVDLTDIIQLKFDGNGDIFLDNIYFYTTGGGSCEDPTVAPPAPTKNAADVISVFSDAYTDITNTNFNPGWGQSTVVTTESIGGGSTLKYDIFNFQGTNLGGADGVDQDLSAMEYLHVDMWTCDATVVNVTPISRSTGEKLVSLTPISTGQWNSYDIPLSAFTGVSMADIFQLKFDGQAGNTPSKVFVDNIYFYKGSGGGGDPGPTGAAPTPPAKNAGDVISFFSNAYTNTTVDSWSAVWDDSDVEDLQVAGNDIKKYTFTNFAGIDFSNHKVNASAMTHFHLDLWTPDAIIPGKVITIKGVDFGGTSAEVTNFILTVTHTPNGDIPALAQGTWISINLPVSAFSENTTRSDLAQILLTSNVRNVYVDNLYFYK